MIQLLRFALAAAGAMLLSLPFVAGSLSLVGTAPVFVAATGVAAVIAGAAVGTRYQSAGGWAAVAVVGQAAALQLIEAGTSVGYQHYRLLSSLDSSNVQLSAAVIGLQAVAVVAVAVRNRQSIRERLTRELVGWRVLPVAVLFVLTAATLSPTVADYVAELTFAAALQSVNAGTIAVAVVALPAEALPSVGRWARRWFGAGGDSSPADLVVPLAAAVWAAGVALLLAVVAYQRHPHIADEVAYLLHARYLAEGQLSLPVPPVPEAFDVELMFRDGGRWYSPVPPGWPAVLAVGVLAGAPWLVNPVLAGVSVLLAHRLLKHLYDENTARVGTLLLAVSPWFLFLSMSLMNHTVVLAVALMGALAVARLRECNRPGWAALAGGAAGVVSLVRPLDGLVVGVVLGCWIVAAAGRTGRFKAAAVFGITAAVVAAAVMPYNHHLTGDPTLFPIMEYTDAVYGAGSNALGFGPDRGLGWGGFDPFPGHDLLDALINTNLNSFALNTELFGWSCGSLLPVLLLTATRRINRTDLAMMGVVALVVVLYGLYWFSGGPDFGPRYWFLVLLPCTALTARALPVVGRLLSPRRSDGGDDDGSPGRSFAVTRGALAMGLACFAAMTTFVPWRTVDKYHHYRGMRPGARRLPTEIDQGAALVLVRGDRWPDYASAAVYNPLDLRSGGFVYAWDRGPGVRRELLSAYPDREVWVVAGPTRTGDGFRVVGRLERQGGPK